MADGSAERVLVTGASGFIGSHLVHHLVTQGLSVRATSRTRPRWLDRPLYRDVSFVPHDLGDASAPLDALVSGIDRVYHLAAVFDFFATAEEMHRTTVLGTERLVRAARAAGVPELVLFSSAAVYGPSAPGEAATEATPCLPRDRYAKSKLASEHAALAAAAQGGGPALMILRPGGVYGPGSRYGDAQALRLLKLGVLCGKPGWRPRVASHIYVRDVVRAAHALAERPESWVPGATDPARVAWNLVDRAPMANHDLLLLASRAMPEKGLLGYWRWLWLPGPTLKLLAIAVEAVARLIGKHPPFESIGIDYLVQNHAASGAKLLAAGFELAVPDARDGLRETIAWYERTGWASFRAPPGERPDGLPDSPASPQQALPDASPNG